MIRSYGSGEQFMTMNSERGTTFTQSKLVTTYEQMIRPSEIIAIDNCSQLDKAFAISRRLRASHEARDQPIYKFAGSQTVGKRSAVEKWVGLVLSETAAGELIEY